MPKRSVLKDCLATTKEDEVLVISDNDELSDFFTHEALQIGSEAIICYLPSVARPYKNLPFTLESLVSSCRVVITPFQRMREEGEFRRAIIDTVKSSPSRARLGHMPGINLDTIKNCVLKTDLEEIGKLAQTLLPILANSRSIKISTDKGTKLTLEVESWTKCDGDLGHIIETRTWDNIPSGEVFLTLNGGKAEGKLIIDGGYPDKEIGEDEEMVLEIDKGKIVNISGNAAESFSSRLERAEEEGRLEEKGNISRIAEFGIGLNRAARRCNNIIEYEKQLGTIHFGFGNNIFLGGDNRAKEHIDVVIQNPTVVIDDVEVIGNGKIHYSHFERIGEKPLSSYPIMECSRDTVIGPSSEAGIYFIQNEICFRRWLSAKQRIYHVQVGDIETSKIVGAALALIKHKRHITLADLAMDLKLAVKDGRRLLSLMNRYGLVQIS